MLTQTDANALLALAKTLLHAGHVVFPKPGESLLLEARSLIEENEIRAMDNINFTGISGYNHRFDFVIPKSKNAPERFIQSINSPNRETVEGLLFRWNDTKEVRKHDSMLYAFLNDASKKVNPEQISALQTYDVKTVLWSERKKYVEELKA